MKLLYLFIIWFNLIQKWRHSVILTNATHYFFIEVLRFLQIKKLSMNSFHIFKQVYEDNYFLQDWSGVVKYCQIICFGYSHIGNSAHWQTGNVSMESTWTVSIDRTIDRIFPWIPWIFPWIGSNQVIQDISP